MASIIARIDRWQQRHGPTAWGLAWPSDSSSCSGVRWASLRRGQHAMAEVWNIPLRERPGFLPQLRIHAEHITVEFADATVAAPPSSSDGTVGGGGRHG